MSQRHLPLDADEKNSFSSSFSVSSLGSDNNDFKVKFEAEHEKSRKLQDRLAGYKTVVQQFPKTIADLRRKDEEHKQEIAELKVREAENQSRILQLEKFIHSNQFQGKQGLADLDVHPPRERSPSHANSSPSFEIIGKSNSSASTARNTPVKSLQEVEITSPVKSSLPETELHNTATTQIKPKPVLLQEDVGAFPNAAQNIARNTPEQVAGAYPKAAQNFARNTPEQVAGAYPKAAQNFARNTPEQDVGAYPKAAQNFVQLSVKSKPQANVEGAVGPPKTTFELQRGFSANQASTELVPHQSGLNQLNSYPTAKGGIVSVLAFSNGSKKPNWQMEHEALSKKSGSAGAAQHGTENGSAFLQASQNWGSDVPPAATSVVAGTNGAGARPKEWKPLNTLIPEARSNDTLNWRNDIPPVASSVMDIPSKAEDSSADSKPKEWKPLNTLFPESRTNDGNPHVKLTDLSPGALDVQMLRRSTENLVSGLAGDFNHHTRSSLTASLNDLNLTGRLPESMGNQPRENSGSSDDLIKFPSLNTNSPSPVSEHSKIVSIMNNPGYSQQNRAIAIVSDEQSNNLACQLESMVAILQKNDSPLGMSDMLYKFAEKVKNMEAKMDENQALIQRQQVQIQSFSKHSHKEENGRLREELFALKNENETLLEYIATQKNKEAEVEPGWVSVLANQNTTDPVRAHYPNSPIMKKVDTLNNINAKLFRANKDWHNRWEALRHQTQEEKADLELRVKSLESVNRSISENSAAMEEQLKNTTATIKELTALNEKLEEEKSSQQRIIDELNVQLSCLKNRVKDLTRANMILESERVTMKSAARKTGAQHPGNRELETEIGLLKQQLIIFAEDFEKEKKDKLAIESKAERFRKDRDHIRLTLEAKLKKISVQLRTQEDELRAKARQNADLLYQVDELKLKLQREQRKSALAMQNPYNYQPPPPSYQGPSSLVFHSNGTNPSLGMAGYQQYMNMNQTSLGLVHHSSPEHLPGAWKCKHCTYINFPKRTVCDICGYTNTDGESLPINESGSGRHELQSRGEEQRWRMDMGDVVADTP